ncbi:MAG: hypothetical protein F6K26_17150 [Moorea sp. SIO2I5]|nr:hypothetical protein [Moorena sp. SIO2I5]
MESTKKFNWTFSLKLAFLYTLAKLKFIHAFLPDSLNDQLPTGWNNEMFWMALKSGGSKIYYDYYSRLKHPKSYNPKTSVDPQFELSEGDIKFFYENGYLGPFDLMSSDEAEKLRDYLVNSVVKLESKTLSLKAGDYEFDTENKINDDIFSENANKPTEEGKKYFVDRMNSFNRHLDEPKLIDLFKHPAIIERCAQIVGSDLILWRSRFFEIPPYTEGTKFHQASTWLYENQKESVANPPDPDELYQVTAWIALTDATIENGCMKLIPGSHKEIYPVLLGKKRTEIHNNAYGNREGKLDYPIETAEIRPIEMKAGQFFLFCERVLHGSFDNKTDASRWAINGRIARPDPRFYTEKMLNNSHQVKYFSIKKLKLDNWKAVLVRGEDHFGYNRLLK